jgi:hypothetical protein
VAAQPGRREQDLVEQGGGAHVLVPKPRVLRQRASVLGQQLSGHCRAAAHEAELFQYGIAE